MTSVEKLDLENKDSLFNRWFSKPKDGSLRISIVNMIVLSIGAGLFYCPYSLSQVGYISFIFFLIIALYFNKVSFDNFLYWYKDSKKGNIFDIAKYYFGKNFECWTFVIFSSFLVFAYIINFIISKDIVAYEIEKIFNLKWSKSFAIYYSLFFMVILAPTILLTNTDKFKHISLFYVFIVVALLFIIIFQSYSYNSYFNNIIITSPANNFSKEYFKTFSIIIFAYYSQYGIFDLWTNLKNNEYRRCKKVVNYGLIYQFFIVLAISIVGYISLGDLWMNENILKRLHNPNMGSDLIMKCITLIFGLLLIAKGIIVNTVLINQSISYFKLNSNLKNRILIGYSTILLSGVFCIYLPDVLDFIDIAVSIMITYLGYVFPILVYFKAKKNMTKIDYFKNFSILFIILFNAVFWILEKFIDI